MIGSANAEWVPMVGGYQRASYFSAMNEHNFQEASGIVGGAGTGFELIFTLPLPTTKGSLSLYVAGVQIVFVDADINNNMTAHRIYGMSTSGSTLVYSSLTDEYTLGLNRSGSGLDSYGTADDMSSYYSVWGRFDFAVDTVNALEFHSIALLCYYA
jgi:hypothetical protein